MKVDYRDYIDDDFYEEKDENYRQNKPRKFKDSERASAGSNAKKKSIRKKRKEKQKQRKSEEFQREEF